MFNVRGNCIWEESLLVSRVFKSQLSIFESQLECDSGIEDVGADENEVDFGKLEKFLLELCEFGRKTHTPARLLREGVAVLSLALLRCRGPLPEEIINNYSPEVLDLATYIFMQRMKHAPPAV